jgi:hypothetical protein
MCIPPITCPDTAVIASRFPQSMYLSGRPPREVASHRTTRISVAPQILNFPGLVDMGFTLPYVSRTLAGGRRNIQCSPRVVPPIVRDAVRASPLRIGPFARSFDLPIPAARSQPFAPPPQTGNLPPREAVHQTRYHQPNRVRKSDRPTPLGAPGVCPARRGPHALHPG